MKRYIIIGALLVSAITQAHADLHDTYAQSCAKYGGSGNVDKKNKQIYWHYAKSTVVEVFVKDECVSMRIIPDKDWFYAIEQIEAALPAECGTDQRWIPLQIEASDPLIVAQWATTDGQILAALYKKTGVVQFSYRWWLEKKGLLDGSAPAQTAPVEDDLGIKM
jgi:hypothetical protein